MSNNLGQSESTPLGMGFLAYGDGPSQIDNLTPTNMLAAARANLAAIETELRSGAAALRDGEGVARPARG